MLYRSLAVAGFIALGSSGAEAHRYCNSVDEAGSLSALVPDLADERPEFAVVQEATFPNTGGYVQRSLIFDGGTTPICSVEECERYKDLISTGPSHGIKIEHLCLQRLR